MARTIANTKDGIRRLNTRVSETDKGLTVQLYDTVVYQETSTTITLNHGGWVTPTTGSRIHQALRHMGHMNNVNIKNRQMYCDGKPFDANGQFVIKKVA
jgi:hypothetical protein